MGQGPGRSVAAVDAADSGILGGRGRAPYSIIDPALRAPVNRVSTQTWLLFFFILSLFRLVPMLGVWAWFARAWPDAVDMEHPLHRPGFLVCWFGQDPTGYVAV